MKNAKNTRIQTLAKIADAEARNNIIEGEPMNVWDINFARDVVEAGTTAEWGDRFHIADEEAFDKLIGDYEPEGFDPDFAEFDRFERQWYEDYEKCTTEQERIEMRGFYSDVYKDYYGFRPHWKFWCDPEDVERECA